MMDEIHKVLDLAPGLSKPETAKMVTMTDTGAQRLQP